MLKVPEERYANHRPAPPLRVPFDLDECGGMERILREKAAWKGYAEIEILSPRYAVLNMYPGGALRLTR
jgi:hypothetical protein